MELNLTLNQYRLLKLLALTSGLVFLKDLKPKPSATPEDRSKLIAAGLIEQAKQKGWMTLAATDKGRAYLGEHPEEPKKAKAPPKPKPKPITIFPTFKQRLFMFHLAFLPADIPAGGWSKVTSAGDRAPLIEKKWVTKERVGKSDTFSLTDAGWEWLESHFGEPVPGKLPELAVSAVFARLGTYLRSSGHRLSDLMRNNPASTKAIPDDEIAETPEASTPRFSPAGDIKSAIRAACLRLGNGQIKQRIRLSALRRELSEWPREAVDQALLDLSLSSDLALFGIDDPQEMTQDDRDGVFLTPSGQSRHLVYWTQN